MHVRELKVRRFLIRQSFLLAAEVVCEVAYGPSEERVRGRARGGPRQGVEELAERFDWISVGRGLAPRCRVCRVRTAAPEPSAGIGSEERVPGQLRVRQGGIEEERPMPTLQATEESDWVPPADRTYGEPHGLRHRWGIGRAHLRFWVAGPTQGEARADRSGEQLDPDPVRILDVDFRAFRLLRRHRGLRSLSDQLAVRLLRVVHDEGEMVDLLSLSIGGIEPGSRRIPVQFESLAGTSPLELDVLAAMRHRPPVHDPHPERLRVEGERARQVPHANARVVEAVLHENMSPRWPYVVATVIRRPVPLALNVTRLRRAPRSRRRPSRSPRAPRASRPSPSSDRGGRLPRGGSRSTRCTRATRWPRARCNSRRGTSAARGSRSPP